MLMAIVEFQKLCRRNIDSGGTPPGLILGEICCKIVGEKEIERKY